MRMLISRLRLERLIFCGDPSSNWRGFIDLLVKRNSLSAPAVSFPGSVIAMIILFILLAAGVIKVGHIRQKAEFMLKNMAFFFIPAGVGIMEYFDVLKSCIVPFIVICVVSTILTFAATAGTVALIMRLQHRYRGRKGGDQDA